MKYKTFLRTDPNLESKIRQAIDTTKTMRAAAQLLDINYQTFRTYAKRFGIFAPNQGAAGKQRGEYKTTTPLIEILQGKHPNFSTGHLKSKLLKSGLKKNACEECGITEWLGKHLMCQLEHIDGDRHNHRLENLKMLCPNCHSQTPTFSGRNSSKSKKRNAIVV